MTAFDTDPGLPLILVIDDDHAVAVALRARLAGHYRVSGLTDPAAAVELVRGLKPRLVMCDINMPRMTGDEVALALSLDEQTRFTPVVFLTSLLPRRAVVELGDQFGGYMGISKHSDTGQLLEVIRGALVG
ncbi:response regulator [Variovorax terrae]|uniref:Response regulator n=1 Tax=Variovorax terrae TaxID=2923278 RepID=A0A9X2ANQ1_9BURK|nr:response regulator [Variovorax terrae]MCJ0762622.1 response regulator [Variovorax terrae]